MHFICAHRAPSASADELSKNWRNCAASARDAASSESRAAASSSRAFRSSWATEAVRVQFESGMFKHARLRFTYIMSARMVCTEAVRRLGGMRGELLHLGVVRLRERACQRLLNLHLNSCTCAHSVRYRKPLCGPSRAKHLLAEGAELCLHFSHKLPVVRASFTVCFQITGNLETMHD